MAISMATKQFLFLALIILGLVCVINGQQRGTVRLVRNGLTSTSYSSGRVQVYMGDWGYICGNSDFASAEADVICHQLGYSGALSYSRSAVDSYGVSSNYSFLMSNVDCDGEYLVILQCLFSFYVSSSCQQYSDEVSVTCLSTRIWDSPYKGQVRLSRGKYSNQGLVEVYCNGQWGTVCGDGFDQIDADTVCKQLGYTGAAQYNNSSLRGSSSQPIWLNNVDCGSFVNCIQDCQPCPSYKTSNCTHFEDITVECEYKLGDIGFTEQSTCNYDSASDGTSVTSSTIPNVPSSTIIIVGVVVTVIFLILPVAIPLSICACIVVVVASTRRNRCRTAYPAVPTSPPDQPTVAVSTSVNSYQPVNQSFYPTGTNTPSTNPPPYTPGDPTSSPAHPSGDEKPAINPLPTTSNVV